MRGYLLLALSIVCLLLGACGEDDTSSPEQVPSVTISSPVDGQSFPEGTEVVFQGSATDPQDGTLSGTALVWRSAMDGRIGTGENVTTSSLSVNTHTITLTATNSDDISSSDQISIAVEPAGPPDIDVTPSILEMTAPVDSSVTDTITVSNVGSSVLDVSLVADDAAWLSESPTVFTLPAGADTMVTVTADAAALSAGTYEATVTISSNDPDEDTTTVDVTLTVTGGVEPLLEMIQIDGGTFWMGSDYYGTGSDELPVHSVTISTFLLAKHEVTQLEYLEVMGTIPSHFLGTNRPVEQVTWWNAAKFCNALSQREGLTKFYNDDDLNSEAGTVRMNWDADGYRLPTEAEWEYACRANSTTEFYWGNIVNVMYCWYSANSGSRTHDVATRLPNNWGLCDMAGNVWEWCNDWGGSYSSDPQSDPTGPSTGETRVVRGGSWSYSAECCRSAFRGSFPPSDSFNHLGFRPARR